MMKWKNKTFLDQKCKMKMNIKGTKTEICQMEVDKKIISAISRTESKNKWEDMRVDLYFTNILANGTIKLKKEVMKGTEESELCSKRTPEIQNDK